MYSQTNKEHFELSGFKFIEGWISSDNAFSQTNNAIALAHFIADQIMCLFTDAFDTSSQGATQEICTGTTSGTSGYPK
jgi:hypothetical protein